MFDCFTIIQGAKEDHYSFDRRKRDLQNSLLRVSIFVISSLIGRSLNLSMLPMKESEMQNHLNVSQMPNA
jgi:hypothetical protein